MKRRITILLAAAALLVGGGAGCAASEPERLTTYAMGSVVQQTVYGSEGQEVAAQAASSIQELENRISWRVEGSAVARLNAGAGNDKCDAYDDLLLTARGLAEETDGAFDPTIGPVTRLWDFDGEPHVPDPKELAAALELVDYQRLRSGFACEEQEDGSNFTYGTMYLETPGMAVDLGALGKGAACDAALSGYEAMRRLHPGSVTGAVIAVGGRVAVFGQKPDQTPWRVAVRDPKTDGTLGEIEMNSGYVSTSGSYEKTFTENGKTYHHILDPSTGYPAESGLVSVTVWMTGKEGAGSTGLNARSQTGGIAYYNHGAAADALSTACFVLGVKDSLPVLEKFGAEAIFITEDDEIYCTDGIREAFTLDPDKGYTLKETLP